jgi:Cd2+/Zn2+-exporting ATPase
VRGLTLVVIACPCAFVISTPVSGFSAITSGAKQGVLVTGGRYLEALAMVDAVAFDRTGTLTTAELTVTDVIPAPDVDETELLGVVRGIETRSDHPIAAAIVEHAEERGVAPAEVTDFESMAGRGVRATVEGETYRIGRPELFDRPGGEDGVATDGGAAARTATEGVPFDTSRIGELGQREQRSSSSVVTTGSVERSPSRTSPAATPSGRSNGCRRWASRR